MLLWSAFFWYVAAYGLTDKYLAGGERITAMPGVVTMSVLAYEGVGSLLDWQALRRGMRVAWILMPTAALWQLAHGVHPAQDGGWLAWPSLYVVSLWIFRRQERQRPVTGAAVMRGLTLWLPTVLATIEFVWWTVELKLGGAWHTAAYCVCRQSWPCYPCRPCAITGRYAATNGFFATGCWGHSPSPRAHG